MVTIPVLWLPILLSAVIVFVVSSIIHMATPWHKADFRKFAAEDEVLDALRRFDLAPGDYAAPRADSNAEMGTPEYKAKIERGPQVMLTVMRPGISVAGSLVWWFVYLIIVGVFAACVTSIAFGPGEPYLNVFRAVTLVAFAGYALATWQGWIWYSRGLGSIIRSTLDGLIYALLTGGVFGWLWP